MEGYGPGTSWVPQTPDVVVMLNPLKAANVLARPGLIKRGHQRKAGLMKTRSLLPGKILLRMGPGKILRKKGDFSLDRVGLPSIRKEPGGDKKTIVIDVIHDVGGENSPKEDICRSGNDLTIEPDGEAEIRDDEIQNFVEEENDEGTLLYQPEEQAESFLNKENILNETTNEQVIETDADFLWTNTEVANFSFVLDHSTSNIVGVTTVVLDTGEHIENVPIFNVAGPSSSPNSPENQEEEHPQEIIVLEESPQQQMSPNADEGFFANLPSTSKKRPHCETTVTSEPRQKSRNAAKHPLQPAACYERCPHKWHTFMSCDSLHHLIELSMKKKKFVYDMEDFASAVRDSSRKNRVIIKIMEPSDFVSYRDESSISKRNIDRKTKKKILLTNVSSVEFRRSSLEMFYKTDLETESWDVIDFLKAVITKSGRFVAPIRRQKACGVPVAVKNDITSKLLRLMPDNRRSFWTSLPIQTDHEE
ncbi:hypothetical protein GE061_010988 [Apolygus lucorum]|uniref:Uncharacterized protein n=1 Tax=Apolygus lucorum TaxID=248454 RepID=A0A8S9XW51_APOLU|nr:hypothetical protein GE061_010988 [Apolygus lucorum]